MTENTKTSTIVPEYNALTSELRTLVIRYFTRQVKTRDIKAEIIQKAERYFNPWLFGRDEMGGTNAMVRERIITAITETEAITLIPLGRRIEEIMIYLNAKNTCEVNVCKIITPVPNLSKYTDDIIHAEDLAAAICEITSELRDKIINDGIRHALNTQNKAKPIRISTAVIQNTATVKKQILDLNDSLLPKTIISEIKQQGLIEWHNQNGQGFNLSPFYWDIILAIVEINASKSETQNENSPNFYLGNATEINRQGEKTAHVTASLYEIAKTVYGGTKPGGKDQIKIEEALKDISINPKLRPLLIYPIYDNTTTDSKGKTKRVQRTITTYKPILEIFSLNETTTIDGGKPKQTNEILIRLNEIFIQDIKCRFVELRGDYLLQRNMLSKTLGARPQMLNDFYLLIRNAWGYRNRMEKDAEGRPVFIIGLMKNANGEEGLYYKLGYANYEKNGNKKRFELAYNKSIEYLKGLGEIIEYAVTKDEWGHQNAMFVLPLKTKKSRVIDE